MIQIAKAVRILQSGGVVVYPTDTAYGLAVDATNLAAVKKLYRLKGRGFHKPIHIIPPSMNAIGLFARISHTSKVLTDKFWPGPLTIVLPLEAKGKAWQLLSAGTKTIGIRWPDHRIAQALAQTLGKPITTTSANRSGQPNTYSVKEVQKQFQAPNPSVGATPDFYLDGGKLKHSKPSTVVSLISGRVKILREGPVSETQIKNALLQSKRK